MIQKKKKQIKLIVLIIAIIMLITGGTVWFLNSNNFTNKTTQNDQIEEKIDFSSKALVVVTDRELENTYNAVSFNKTYSGKYVLKFETVETTKKAYEELKKDNTIQDVYVDTNLRIQDNQIMTISFDILGKNVESWGTYTMGLNKTQNKINSNTNKQEIVVAVIDTGFDLTNTILTEQNLMNRVDVRYKNMTDNSNNITDNEDMPHGTHVGGIILDGTPDNVKILPIKIEDQDGCLSLEYVNSAIRYAIDQNVDIINMSLGNEFDNTNNTGLQTTKQLIEEAIEKNIVVVAAVGNGDEDGNRKSGENIYPAAFEGVIGVGALKTNLITFANNVLDVDSYILAQQTQKSNLSYAGYSNYGSVVDFSAPGSYILSLGKNEDSYLLLSGTSQATPHVTAAIATIKSYNKDFTNNEVLDALKNYTVDLGTEGRDNDYGEGMVCFNNYQECTCGCEECDEIYCTGCVCADCKYHTQLTKVLKEIKITTNPTKMIYTEGETFNPAGMIVTAVYSDNSTETVTDYTYTPTETLTKTDTTVTVTYKEKQATLSITVNEVPEVTVSEIQITKKPTKMIYTEGENFDPAGMIITAVYSDGSTTTEDFYDYEPKGKLTKSDTTITIKCQGKTATLNITVNEKIPEKTLSKIEITTNPTKIIYTEGERFDPAGMVITALYSDNSREIITNYTYEPSGILTQNDKLITVTYKEKTATLDITVNSQMEQKTLDRIEVTTKPTKTEYIIGEKFNPDGMVITAIYTDGSTETVTDYTYEPKGELTSADKKIEIVYKGKTTSVNISVNSNTLTKTLKAIEITTNPTKTTYTVGEKFDSTGMVITAIYTDGTRSVIKNYNCFPITALTANHTKITVSYTEDGTTVTATLPIEVKNSNNNNSNNNNNKGENQNNSTNNGGNVTNGVVNNNTQTIQIKNDDNTTKNSNLAYTGAETYILPIIIIAIIGGIAFIKYRQYKEI